MTLLPLGVQSEYGRLRAVVVNAGAALVPNSEIGTYHARYGSRIEEEVQYHPEAAPWDPDRVRAQHAGFIAELEGRGCDIHFTRDVPGGIYALFTRDVGFVIGDTFFCARLGDGVRRIEQEGLADLTPRFPRVARLASGIVEGGDVMVHGHKVFVGVTSYSTDREGFEGLRAQLEPRGYECIPIRLRENVLHLDCRLSILSPEHALLHSDDVHPDDAQRLEREFRIIPVRDEELETLALNVLSIAPGQVIMDARNRRVAAALEAEGFETIPLEFDEVSKLWGAFRCATLPLYREEDGPPAERSPGSQPM